MSVTQEQVAIAIALVAPAHRGKLPSAILEKCTRLCSKHSLTSQDLASKLEAFLSNNESDTLTLEFMGKFEQDVIKELKIKKEDAQKRKLDSVSKLERKPSNISAAVAMDALQTASIFKQAI